MIEESFVRSNRMRDIDEFKMAATRGYVNDLVFHFLPPRFGCAKKTSHQTTSNSWNFDENENLYYTRAQQNVRGSFVIACTRERNCTSCHFLTTEGGRGYRNHLCNVSLTLVHENCH